MKIMAGSSMLPSIAVDSGSCGGGWVRVVVMKVVQCLFRGP